FSMLSIYITYTNGRRQAKISKLEEILSAFFYYKTIYINLHFFTTEITRYSDLEYRRNNNNRYESSMEVIDDFISQTKDQEFIDKAAKLHVLINTYCSNKKDYKILALTIN